MEYTVLEVPYHAGDGRHPSCAGPRRIVEGGAIDVLAAHGDVAVEAVGVDEPFRDTVSSTVTVEKAVAERVAAASMAGRLPVILTGSCATALGVLAGFDHADCGAVWLDAHPDFNTPETTASGFFPGMSLAVVTGDCYRACWAAIGHATPVPQDAVALFGVRDVSPEAEGERLSSSAVSVVEWRDGQPQDDPDAVVDELAARVREVYLHIHLDCFAPEVAPGVADDPVPGGLSLGDAERIVRATAGRMRVRAVTLATYNPTRDPKEKTLGAVRRVIQTLGEVIR